MFSKLYKELYYQRWFRQLCLTDKLAHDATHNPAVWHEKQNALDKVFGKSDVE